jgi:four helix bundle protein
VPKKLLYAHLCFYYIVACRFYTISTGGKTIEANTIETRRWALDHENLDVYQLSVEFVVIADEIVEHLPRGRAYLNDQLRRAALSIVLNIAEGAGEYALEEKIRFYRMAKRSATECAGILDVCQRLQLVTEHYQAKGRELLVRIVSMLIKMARR